MRNIIAFSHCSRRYSCITSQWTWKKTNAQQASSHIEPFLVRSWWWRPPSSSSISFLSGIDREHCWQLDNREANLPMKDRSLFKRQTGSCRFFRPIRDSYIEKHTHTHGVKNSIKHFAVLMPWNGRMIYQKSFRWSALEAGLRIVNDSSMSRQKNERGTK